MEDLRNVVVVVYLRRPDERFRAETLRNELLCGTKPVYIGFRSNMSVPVARRAAEFALDFDFIENFKFASETCSKIYELFADSRGSCRLAVRSRHHGNSLVRLCDRFDFFKKFAKKFSYDLLSLLYHQRV